LIVGQAIGALFRLAPAAHDDHRDGCQPPLYCCTDPQMAGEQLALLVGQHRHRPPPFVDGCGDFVEVGFAV
jgi:hypothetical protein